MSNGGKANIKASKTKAKAKAKAKAKVEATKNPLPSAPKSPKKGVVGTKPAVSQLTRIFVGAGFKSIHSDDIHFKLEDRMGEIDHIFVWENVVLLCEETTSTTGLSQHCTKKIFFHKLIANDWSTFHASYSEKNTAYAEHFSTGKYTAEDLEVRHLYFSSAADLDVGVKNNAEPFMIMSRAEGAYFETLIDTIEHSAKFELLKYLSVRLEDVGDAKISGSGVGSNSFAAFALPANHTNYPKGFAVVSFYADPQALITRAYVLRRDGWGSPDLSYQRFVRHDKLSEMRDYLANSGKVFINNLIVTLPPSATMRAQDSGKVLAPKDLTSKTAVKLDLPLELGTVGIVDGQHRVLAYYEGLGASEAAIGQLRKRQNLLVTGIIFPEEYSPEERVKFEAELFLSINNTQTGVKRELRQDLEVLIKPYTAEALARSVLTKLAETGPLSGMLQVSQFDPPDKIKSASLVTYVLQPLVKPSPSGPLHKLWDPSKQRDLQKAAERSQYVDFCASHINGLLAAARQNMPAKWKSATQSGVLSTTVIGGLILVLKRLYDSGDKALSTDLVVGFKDISQFDFSPYSSSSWAKLASQLVSQLKIAPSGPA